MYMLVDMYQNLIALIYQYNSEVAIPQNLTRIDPSSISPSSTSSEVRLPCKVANIGD